jgi:hypothetical protein
MSLSRSLNKEMFKRSRMVEGLGGCFRQCATLCSPSLWGALERVRERDRALGREVDQEPEGVPFS